jgi:hypothetical protein
MEPVKPEVPALRVEVEGPLDELTAGKVAEAIKQRLATESTDLFEKDDTLVLLVQHQVRGTPE